MRAKRSNLGGRLSQRPSVRVSRSTGSSEAPREAPREEFTPMLNVEEQTTRLEHLYRQLTGSDPKRADQPIAPIPPESNPEQYVQENLQRLQLALQGLGV